MKWYHECLMKVGSCCCEELELIVAHTALLEARLYDEDSEVDADP